MQTLFKPEPVVKILSTILFICFIVAIGYIWVQLGHYNFDNNKAHLHVDMHNQIHPY